MRLGLVFRLTTAGRVWPVLAQSSRVERPPARPIANQSFSTVVDRDVAGACSCAPGPRPTRMVTSYLQRRSSAKENTISGQRLGQLSPFDSRVRARSEGNE
jgi:hypothetical protein